MAKYSSSTDSLFTNCEFDEGDFGRTAPLSSWSSFVISDMVREQCKELDRVTFSGLVAPSTMKKLRDISRGLKTVAQFIYEQAPPGDIEDLSQAMEQMDVANEVSLTSLQY